MHGLNRWHKPSRGHHAFVQWGSCSSCYSWSCPRPCKQKMCATWSNAIWLQWMKLTSFFVPEFQPIIEDLIKFFAPRQADLDVFCHVPHDHFGFQEPLHGRCTWDQFDGWAYAQGRLPVLCLCGRASEGSLPQHFVLQVANQSGNHLLQLSDAGGVIGQEDHRAWLLVLFHPLPHVPVSQESGLPRLQEWSLPVFGVFGPLHKRHWHSVCERGDQLWLSQELWDLPASHWPLWPFRSLGLGHQFCDIWWPLQPLPYWERVGHRDPAYPSDHWPGHLHLRLEDWRMLKRLGSVKRMVFDLIVFIFWFYVFISFWWFWWLVSFEVILVLGFSRARWCLHSKAYVLDMLGSFTCALRVLCKVCMGAVHVWLVLLTGAIWDFHLDGLKSIVFVACAFAHVLVNILDLLILLHASIADRTKMLHDFWHSTHSHDFKIPSLALDAVLVDCKRLEPRGQEERMREWRKLGKSKGLLCFCTIDHQGISQDISYQLISWLKEYE